MSKRRQERSEQETKLPIWRMKTESSKRPLTPPPPPPPPRYVSSARLPRKAQVSSVTRAEIESFWRRKRMEEEDHLLAALKAAARIRARNLKKEDYEQFEASVERILAHDSSPEKGKELGVVIRDWWTKSKYAYLNQPAVHSMETEAARHPATFTPSSYFCAAAVAPWTAKVLGVF